MTRNYLLLFLIVLVIGVGSIFIIRYSSQKLAYVRSSELVSKYKGMQEASALYKEKMAKWQANIDTLEVDYQRSVGKYNLEFSKLSATSRKESQESLQKQRQNIQQYVKTLDEKAREEDEKMTVGVINQINSFVESYGKDNGYDFIFGTTQDGNILYGSKGKDITEDIITALNNSYKNDKK